MEDPLRPDPPLSGQRITASALKVPVSGFPVKL